MRISDWSSDVCSSDLERYSSGRPSESTLTDYFSGEPFRPYDIKLYYPHIGVGFDAPLQIWLKISILRSAGHQLIAASIGRAHVYTPVTNAQIACRLLIATRKTIAHTPSLTRSYAPIHGPQT